MADDRKVDEFEVKTALGSLAAKGIRISDILALAVTAILALLLYIMLQHIKDSNKNTITVANAIMKQTEMQQKSIVAQTLTSCILAVEDGKRDEEFRNPNSFCHRITGG
jgi:aspartate carbamoyltransferase regulatory subunit